MHIYAENQRFNRRLAISFLCMYHLQQLFSLLQLPGHLPVAGWHGTPELPHRDLPLRPQPHRQGAQGGHQHHAQSLLQDQSGDRAGVH